MTGFLIPLAALADALLGDPPFLPHPVRWVGWCITWLENQLRRFFHTPTELRLAGVILAVAVVGGTGLVVWALSRLGGAIHPWVGGALALVLAWQSLAAGQLWREAARVLRALEREGLESARNRLSMIVGRETAALDEAAIRRAVVETVAENFNDGVLAPLCYLALGGPILAWMYKAVNTLDSMVGYRNQRYLYLGWASARLDDLAGWVPARLSALALVGAARLLGGDWRGAWRVAQRDHGLHKSPNSAWPEAAMAGALHLRLGGPNRYHGQMVEKPWINAAGTDPGPGEARLALRLMAGAALVALVPAWLINLLIYL